MPNLSQDAGENRKRKSKGEGNCRAPLNVTSKRRLREISKMRKASFPLRDVIISMEPTSQPEGWKFTVERKGAANSKHRDIVAAGQILTAENGTTLHLGWWGDVTVSVMHQLTGRFGSVDLAIAQPTSK